LVVRPAARPGGTGGSSLRRWNGVAGRPAPTAFLHVVRAARVDQNVDRDLVGKGSGVARGAPLRPTVGSIAHLARGASGRGRGHRVGHRMDGGGDGPAQPLRRAGAVAPAPGLRVCGGGHRLLGGDGPDARFHAVPPRGRCRWGVVLLALACLGSGRRPAACPIRVQVAFGARFPAASDHRLPGADGALRHDVRPRTLDGDGSRPRPAQARVVPARCAPPECGRHRGRRADRRGAGGRCGFGERERPLELLATGAGRCQRRTWGHTARGVYPRWSPFVTRERRHHRGRRPRGDRRDARPDARMVVVSFAAFFLLGLPALLGLVVGAVLWGVQAGFGGAGPLQPWLAGAGGAALLALALNTGAALPIYWSLIFGSGRRLDRLREAWSNYWAVFRQLVMPACALFGLIVFKLLASG